MKTISMHKSMAIIPAFFLLFSSLLLPAAEGATMQDYCAAPPFVMQPVPPLVLLNMGRDHKIYYEAFNDAYDLDGDGRLDTHYKHSIDYYGYFDPNRCYTYQNTGTRQFLPVTASISTDKFCAAGQWSGNVLNYLTMSKMDVIRKVFYGGFRGVDNNGPGTVLERTFIPQDAHSWGKEVTGRLCNSGTSYTNQCITDAECSSGYSCVDKSVNLIGIAASTAPVTCVPNPVTTPWTRAGQILLAKYNHATGTTMPSNHATLVSSYEPNNSASLSYITNFSATALNPANDHGNYFNYYAETEFQVTAGTAGVWKFALDSDAAAEIEIDGAVVASWYGTHTRENNNCSSKAHTGTINLNVGWHTLIVRHFESTGNDGARVWYWLPGAAANSCTIFGNTLTLRSPDIDPTGSGNRCSIMTASFIATGIPDTSTFTYGAAKYHLFCNTSLGDGSSDPPLLRLMPDRDERIWQWVSKERPVCDSSLGTPTDYEVRVSVCGDNEDGIVGAGENTANQTAYFQSYCQKYNTAWKPRGLLQKYSEGDGTKVCSIQFSKACNTNSDCLTGEGECVAKSKMLFGLLSGSFTNHMSGGVIRKGIGNFLDEVESNSGQIVTSENVRGNIASTIDRMRPIGFNYGSYDYGCGWITNGAMTEGTCKMWGNPVAEMLYEAERYFVGKQYATAAFLYGAGSDSGLNLSVQGCSSAGSPSSCKNWVAPYSLYPSCARPFILTFSDVSPSYDSNQVPGSYFNSFTGDISGLNVSTLADTIGTTEGIGGTSRFVGQSGASTDFLCSSKSVTNLSSVRGICPEEPTKQGTFYSAAVAYHAKEKLKVCSNNQATVCNADSDCTSGGKCSKRNITNYSVALSSPVPDLGFTIGGKKVTFIPTGKSVDGCLGVGTNCNCTFTRDANGLHMTNCTGFCPTNQIVDFYVDTVTYDGSNNLTYAKFRINFEDVEQGADHDMDAIVTYEIEPDPSDPTNKINVELTSEYAAGCIDQAMGFVITGTTEDGVYLPVRDVDGTTSTRSGPLPLNWSKSFTVTGAATSSTEDPLWYAAKWGGFDDTNNNGIPDLQSEWDKDNDGIPDNYFLVVNPQKMEQQIEEAFLSILRRASSGTAASVLASGEGSGANLVQAIFYPKRMFDKEIEWTGTLQNLWYYLDPRLGNSTIREDSDGDYELELDQDWIVNMFFDTAEQRTKANRWASSANGTPGAQQTTVYLEELRYLWESGSQLHARTGADPRLIYTNLGGNTFTPFTTALAPFAAFQSAVQAADTTEATNIINYVRGDSDGTGKRNRTITDSDTGTTGIWKLGDIVNSTPKIVSWIPINQYDKTYADTTYAAFLKTSTYQNRGMVFTGANDGMLHAFKLGTLGIVKDGSAKKATLTGTNLGREQWAFIPMNSLPYLKYLMDPAYCHLYYVDLTPTVFDASIEAPGVNTSDYWTQTKTSSSWRTILIGGMKLGGACKNANYSAAFAGDPFVKIPPPAIAGYTEIGYSSYFAIDITDPESPSLMWEFSSPDLGYSTSGPSVVRINSREVPSGFTTSVPNKKTNGKWHVVFASGPTGSIGTDRQFTGYSDQPLRLFILDAKTGTLMRTIDTGTAAVVADRINYAFGGSLNNANIDYDFDYQDDALYMGYTKSDAAPPTNTVNSWTNGGVIRLVTREDLDGTSLDPSSGNTALNPNNWAWSHVVKNLGSVTASVAHLAHYRSGSTKPDLAWLYLGTGRFFYRGDDDTARMIGGIKDACLRDVSAAILPTGLTVDSGSQFYAECTNGATSPPAAAQVLISDLTDKTCSGLSGTALAACVAQPCVTSGVPMVGNQLIQCLSDRSYKGWYITLDSPPAERVITDPLATPTGVVFYTTFAPSPDICRFGGTSYLWAVNYETGGSVGSTLSGKGLLQVSTGAIEEIDLKTAFTEEGGRRTTAIDGVPPTGQGLAVVVPPKPVGKIMHIRKE